MAFNFPNSPSNGDIHIANNGTSYVFDGSVWNSTKDGIGLPTGGSTGQFLVKNSDDNFDLTYKTTAADGGGSDEIFYLNGQTVGTDYTVPVNFNAMSAGPITIDSNVTVTISNGSNWTIV